jgi:hypothetical protein
MNNGTILLIMITSYVVGICVGILTKDLLNRMDEEEDK